MLLNIYSSNQLLILMKPAQVKNSPQSDVSLCKEKEIIKQGMNLQKKWGNN